ncbi:hypothetical protein LWM68_33825 [Niabella sp. W65]|nr:hypothetical protein [Niabella sp. W65]MCH7367305.1 hypothetical protein [Niabella sp. W65]ULT42966.1 hypothetical protein KRR40_05335 [Niabella sp. I65]
MSDASAGAKRRTGKCPLCGMTLVPVGSTSASHQHTSGHGHAEHSSHDHEKEGFNKHAGHHTGDFLKRFWVSLVITVPILLLSHMIQQWLGFSLAFTGDKYVLLALGTAIYLYGGLPFLKGMMGEMKAKAIGMMTLVAIAISVAYIYSVAVVFGLQGMDFFGNWQPLSTSCFWGIGWKCVPRWLLPGHYNHWWPYCQTMSPLNETEKP